MHKAQPAPVSKAERIAAQVTCLTVCLTALLPALSNGLEDLWLAFVFIVPHFLAAVWFLNTRPSAVAGAAAASAGTAALYWLAITRPFQQYSGGGASMTGLLWLFFIGGSLAVFLMTAVLVNLFPDIYRKRPLAAAAAAASSVALPHIPLLLLSVYSDHTPT